MPLPVAAALLRTGHRQEAHLVALFDSGDHSTAELAELFGVTRSTVYRAVERERLAPVWTEAPSPVVED
jgi:predicted DNA-binding protein YlxM (UPF0122 family)